MAVEITDSNYSELVDGSDKVTTITAGSGNVSWSA